MRHCVRTFLVLLLTVLALASPAQGYGAVRIEEATERAREVINLAFQGAGNGSAGRHHQTEVPRITVSRTSNSVQISFVSGSVSFNRETGDLIGFTAEVEVAVQRDGY